MKNIQTFVKTVLSILCILIPARQAMAAQPGKGPSFTKVMIVVLENTGYNNALQQPFLSELVKHGASFTNFFALSRPSQPNYIAMVAGDTFGVRSNDNVTLDERHLVDLLEENGKSWKVYAEDFPGNCFLGAKSGAYVRRHVPFLSFKNVQSIPARCARILEARQFDADVRDGGLPDFAMYIPNNLDNGHDTGATHADRWLRKRFGSLLSDRRFMKGMLFVVTFDEGFAGDNNHIYTVFLGDDVMPSTISEARYDHYSVLRTIQNAFGLPSLGRHDAQADVIRGIWK